MSEEENAVTLLIPPFADSLGIVITSRESPLSVFPSAAPLLYFSSRMIFSLFLSLCEISFLFQCVWERTRRSHSFVMKFFFMKTLFLPRLIIFFLFQSMPEHWRCGGTDPFPVLCLSSRPLSTPGFFLIVQRVICFISSPTFK